MDTTCAASAAGTATPQQFHKRLPNIMRQIAINHHLRRFFIRQARRFRPSAGCGILAPDVKSLHRRTALATGILQILHIARRDDERRRADAARGDGIRDACFI